MTDAALEAVARALVEADPSITGLHSTHIAMKRLAPERVLAALRALGWTPPTAASPPTLCGCQRCTEARWPLFTDTPPGPATPGWRYACEFCGDKRCPHHQWHGAACPATDAQHADTDGTAALHDPMSLAALYDRVEAVEALLLAVVPAGYVDGKAVEGLRERVVELAGVARV